MLTFYAVLTVLTFMIWGIDKYRASVKLWRVPERVLFTLTFAGGAFGALAGMTLLRHKTRKAQFWFLVLLACVVHAAIIIWWQFL
ncbi:MAG TPA: DUF1294 domain-containing protein [Bellilinea sp.]